ncbi:hypothetical protein K3495_g9614 [Podosphaera aphanis]|nr:hypothetical protein K3495_g9614 [Podosphaera aphanis]
MSSQEDYINVFNDLVNITDFAQFLQGVQKDPERILSAFKSLAEQNHGFNDVSNQLHTAQQEIAKKDQIIISTANNLGEAQERIKSLEEKANTSSSKTQQTEVLRRLANAIESRQPQKCIQPQQVRSVPVPDTSTFCGDKAKFQTSKEGVLLKLTANSDHYPTEQAKMTYVYFMLDSDCQAHHHGFLNNS